MQPDYLLKDSLVAFLLTGEGGRHPVVTPKAAADMFGISTSRAKILLDQIANDGWIVRHGHFKGEDNQIYRMNTDSRDFLDGGGYMSKYKKESSESWPKRNWKIMLIITAGISLIIGFIMAILKEQILDN